MSTNTYLTVSGAVIGSLLALPATAQQDRPGTADQAARTAAESSFDDIDADADGAISRAELSAAVGDAGADELFGQLDADENDEVSRPEWASWQRQRAVQTGASRREVEVAISDDTIEGMYLTDGGMIGLDQSSLGFGLFWGTDRDLVGQGQVMFPGLLGGMAPGFLSLSVGAKTHVAFLADPDDEVFDLAPGAEARLSLPVDPPMAFVGSIFYAPDILTFGDADDVIDLSLRFEVQFLQQTTGFVGYRLLEFDREGGGDDEVADNFQVGLRFAF